MKWIIKKDAGRSNGRKPINRKNFAEKDKGRSKLHFHGGGHKEGPGR